MSVSQNFHFAPLLTVATLLVVQISAHAAKSESNSDSGGNEFRYCREFFDSNVDLAPFSKVANSKKAISSDDLEAGWHQTAKEDGTGVIVDYTRPDGAGIKFNVTKDKVPNTKNYYPVAFDRQTTKERRATVDHYEFENLNGTCIPMSRSITVGKNKRDEFQTRLCRDLKKLFDKYPMAKACMDSGINGTVINFLKKEKETYPDFFVGEDRSIDIDEKSLESNSPLVRANKLLGACENIPVVAQVIRNDDLWKKDTKLFSFDKEVGQK